MVSCAGARKARQDCPSGSGQRCFNGKCRALPGGGNSCECDENWVGPACQFCCRPRCLRGSRCAHFGLNGTACLCRRGWTGDQCSTPELPASGRHVAAPEVFWSKHPAVLPVAVSACSVLVLALVLAFLWRKRALVLMKLVYRLQRYEDGDDKKYDAFISYRSNAADEEFVVQHLLPGLEKHGFRLCVHYRDFRPGETIADNIIEAVKRSRRTILVVSSSYLTGEWPRLEYRVAQQEMLKLRHKIIPLVLHDVSLDLVYDENLKFILSSVTYIKYPSESFWTRLILTMPKRKEGYSFKECTQLDRKDCDG